MVVELCEELGACKGGGTSRRAGFDLDLPRARARELVSDEVLRLARLDDLDIKTELNGGCATANDSRTPNTILTGKVGARRRLPLSETPATKRWPRPPPHA